MAAGPGGAGLRSRGGRRGGGVRRGRRRAGWAGAPRGVPARARGGRRARPAGRGRRAGHPRGARRGGRGGGRGRGAGPRRRPGGRPTSGPAARSRASARRRSSRCGTAGGRWPRRVLRGCGAGPRAPTRCRGLLVETFLPLITSRACFSNARSGGVAMFIHSQLRAGPGGVGAGLVGGGDEGVGRGPVGLGAQVRGAGSGFDAGQQPDLGARAAHARTRETVRSEHPAARARCARVSPATSPVDQSMPWAIAASTAAALARRSARHSGSASTRSVIRPSTQA